MCIVTGEDVHVSNTNIFVGLLDKTHQFTLYSNKVDIGGMNNQCMILPYPKNGTEDGDIKVYDMSKSGDIFKKLRDYFPLRRMLGSFGYANGVNPQSDSLEVFRSGNYDVSLVKSLQDFDRLQFNVFGIDKGIKNLLTRDYSNFGFVVCKLANGKEHHPIAYSHVLENNQFFIPTKHYHNGSEDHNDWDHEIYILGCVDGSTNFSNKYAIQKANINRSILSVLPFGTFRRSDVTQLTVDKYYKNNHDIIYGVNFQEQEAEPWKGGSLYNWEVEVR